MTEALVEAPRRTLVEALVLDELRDFSAAVGGARDGTKPKLVQRVLHAAQRPAANPRASDGAPAAGNDVQAALQRFSLEGPGITGRDAQGRFVRAFLSCFGWRDGEPLRPAERQQSAAVPMGDGELDVAIFCLSLMGSNFTDYLREAHRCLRLDGRLHIWESANYFDDVDAFRAGLAKLGFDVTEPQRHGAFICIRALKSTKTAMPGVVIPSRGKS